MPIKINFYQKQVSISPQEIIDRRAAIIAILRANLGYLLQPVDSPLTPEGFPIKIEVKTTVPQGEGE